MKENYTHIVIVLDRSYSMRACENETREGFNTFVTKQREVKGEATVTLVQFDDAYEVNYEFAPLANIPLLNKDNYVPRGSTALLDAIARTINSTGEKLAALPEYLRPSRVIFVIQTDGEENSSLEFQRHQVFDMIRLQRDTYNWDFVFLGASQESIAEATRLGINSKSTLFYSGCCSNSAFESAADYTTSYRCATDIVSAKLCAFSQEDRDSAVNADSQS